MATMHGEASLHVRSRRKPSKNRTDEMARLISYANRRLRLSPMDVPLTAVVKDRVAKAAMCQEKYEKLGVLKRIIKSSEPLSEFISSTEALAVALEEWEAKNKELEEKLREAEELLEDSPEGGLRKLKEVADRGLADAQYKLGKMHLKATVDAKWSPLKCSPEEGLALLLRASAQGHLLATLTAAKCIFFGQAKTHDNVNASDLVQSCLKELQAKSDEGYTFAKVELASCYFWGIGLPRNLKKALQLYKEAGAKGNAVAQSMVGICHLDGLGLDSKQDSNVSTTATFWLRMAAGRDNGLADLAMGECLIRGFGVEARDRKKGREHARKGSMVADESDPIVQCYMAQAYFFGYVKCAEEDVSRAIELWEASAKAGYWRSQFWLGLCCFTGTHMQQDRERALLLWKQSAENGFWLGQKVYSESLLLGDGFVQDTSLAEDLKRKSMVHQLRLEEDSHKGLDWILDLSTLKVSVRENLYSLKEESEELFLLSSETSFGTDFSSDTHSPDRVHIL